jgi:hypothetical protein
MSRRFTESDNNHRWPLWTPSLPQVCSSSSLFSCLFSCTLSNSICYFSNMCALSSGYGILEGWARTANK